MAVEIQNRAGHYFLEPEIVKYCVLRWIMTVYSYDCRDENILITIWDRFLSSKNRRGFLIEFSVRVIE